MDIIFINKKLEKKFSSPREIVKNWGAENAGKIMQRLVELDAAPCLLDICNLPGCDFHELINNRKCQFSVSIKQPYRLVFVPDHNPIPRKADGGVDLKLVTAICIMEVVNYHD
ncbi:MAG: killer suppression protein [Clostridia bacterium]|nr:killer suppression protein [Clostridia bacterium]